MKIYKIIVMQTSAEGFRMARKAVTELGLENQASIIDYLDADYIRRIVNPQEKQLFITGTVDGDAEPVLALVAELREKSSNLICLSFTSQNLPIPPFHGHIVRRAGDAAVV